jgi:serine/threonine protein kinase
MLGTVLRERYAIEKELSKGGFGETYLAYDLGIPITPKPKCVVKRLIPQHTNEPIVLRLFKQEAATLYKLGQAHDQIPKLYEYFEDGNSFFLIQEFIEGHDLNQEIIPGQKWHQDDVTDLLIEILEVLAYVHEDGIIHRDLKPANIMRRDHDGRLVLIDFGAVKEFSAVKVNQGKTQLTVAIGTPGYMPNEQAAGKPKLSSDIYAVGVIAIRALTGIVDAEISSLEHPETEKIEWRGKARVSTVLASVIDKMVEPSFRDRYKSALEALQAVRSLSARVSSPQPVAPTQIVSLPTENVQFSAGQKRIGTNKPKRAGAIYPRKLGFGFWFQWVLATSVGFAVWALTVELAGGLSVFLNVAISGALLGSTQYLVLRKQLPANGWWMWILATSVSSSIASSVLVGESASISDSLIVVLLLIASFGTFVGFAQWLVLRKQLPANAWWIWIPVNLLGAIIFAVAPIPVYDAVRNTTFAATVGGAAYGSITGVALLLMLRRGSQPNTNN